MFELIDLLVACKCFLDPLKTCFKGLNYMMAVVVVRATPSIQITLLLVTSRNGKVVSVSSLSYSIWLRIDTIGTRYSRLLYVHDNALMTENVTSIGSREGPKSCPAHHRCRKIERP